MKEIVIRINQNNEKNIVLVEDTKIIEQYKQNDQKQENNIYIGKVHDVLEGMQAAFIDIGQEKKVYLTINEMRSIIFGFHNIDEDIRNLSIKKYLKKGMPILVQVKKEAVSTKGAKVTTNLNLIGSYVIIMPYSKFISISKKSDNLEENQRLKQIVKNHLPKNYGAIIRTSAIGKNEEEILKDIKIQLEKLDNINKKMKSINKNNFVSSICVDSNNDLTKKIIIDNINNKIDKIIVNNEIEFNKIKGLLDDIDINTKIEVVLKNEDVFDMYSINTQLEKLEKRKIWLKCGGFITIDKTEALIAIDVNSAKFTGKKDFHQTVLKVNKEASIEIAKQIRLRDLGGIIIIDYINMDDEDSKNEIFEILKNNIKDDRAKNKIIGFTKLKLLEMTRKSVYN